MHGDRIIGVIITEIFIKQGISLRFNLFQQSAVKPCTAVTKVWVLAVFGSENSWFMLHGFQEVVSSIIKCVKII